MLVCVKQNLHLEDTILYLILLLRGRRCCFCNPWLCNSFSEVRIFCFHWHVIFRKISSICLKSKDKCANEKKKFPLANFQPIISKHTPINTSSTAHKTYLNISGQMVSALHSWWFTDFPNEQIALLVASVTVSRYRLRRICKHGQMQIRNSFWDEPRPVC